MPGPGAIGRSAIPWQTNERYVGRRGIGNERQTEEADRARKARRGGGVERPVGFLRPIWSWRRHGNPAVLRAVAAARVSNSSMAACLRLPSTDRT